MNKIIVEQEDIIFENEEVLIEDIRTKYLNIQIYGEVKCGILKISNDILINIYLQDKAILTMDLFVQLNGISNEINVYSNEGTKLDLNYSCIFENTNYLILNNHIISNNTEINVLVRAVEKSGNIEINANGFILENTLNNSYLEDIKALIENSNSVKIVPNLIVDSNSVIANHNATISSVSDDELFYLESRGIKKERAINLLKLGFLKGILQIEYVKREVKINE